LKDGTQLTLGENATLVVDEFIYCPSMLRRPSASTKAAMSTAFPLAGSFGTALGSS
jgi:hypothetical protein